MQNTEHQPAAVCNCYTTIATSDSQRNRQNQDFFIYLICQPDVRRMRVPIFTKHMIHPLSPGRYHFSSRQRGALSGCRVRTRTIDNILLFRFLVGHHICEVKDEISNFIITGIRPEGKQKGLMKD